MGNKLKEQKTYHDEQRGQDLSDVILVIDQLNMNKRKREAVVTGEMWQPPVNAVDRKTNMKLAPLFKSYKYKINDAGAGNFNGPSFTETFGEDAAITEAPEGFLTYAQAYDWFSKVRYLSTYAENGDEVLGPLIWADWITNQ